LNPDFYHINNDLLVKYLLGEATPQEAAAVQDWIAAHPDHQKQFDQFVLIWTKSKELAVSSTVDEHAAWERFKSRVQQSTQPKPLARKMDHYHWWRIAALFVIIAGGALLYFLGQEKPVQTLTVQAAVQPLVDTLPDGSVVTLNKNAQISYPEKFVKETRTITLKGEAFFNVVPDRQSPFIIDVNDVTIRVVGTSFNVCSENGTTEVIVETGVVQVIRNNKVAELHPKERITVKETDSTMVKTVEKDQLYNYYRTKEFVCDNTPLWKLVAALNEAYDSNIMIGRATLRSLPLTVTFQNESLENILNVVSETFEIEVIKEEGRIVLR
jgi:transmembrane sensor